MRFVLGVLLAGCEGVEQDAVVRGADLFENYCAQCHQVDGTGNADIGAPALAGLPAWYVKAQLVKFQTDQRGAHPHDIEGMRMRPMSRTLKTEAQVDDVARYVETLKGAKRPVTLDGDAVAGKVSYTVCVQCHGADGMGIREKDAPPLVYADDWYLKKQIGKFQTNKRGDGPPSSYPMQMRAMSLTLRDDAAMNNVIAYIRTLGD